MGGREAEARAAMLAVAGRRRLIPYSGLVAQIRSLDLKPQSDRLAYLLLRETRMRLGDTGASLPSAHLDWDEATGAKTGFFLWEAFVAGKAKSGDAGQDGHMADARIACEEFAARLTDRRRRASTSRRKRCGP